MLVVIPVSEADSKLIKDFSECLNLFGPYPKHDLLVVARPADVSHCVELFSNLKSLFRNSDLHVFKEDGVRGWPQGPNHYWKQTIVYLMEELKNKLPWFWMELDVTPIKRTWLDDLEKEYKRHGKPCMGWLQNTTTVTDDGTIVPLTKHLVGAAIYPPNIKEHSTVWEFVDKIATAFDVLVQYELVPKSHHTLLFQHCFRTQNYKKQLIPFSCIKGEDNNDFPGGLRFDEPLRHETVVHHGCDDGSLARLIIETYKKK